MKLLSEGCCRKLIRVIDHSGSIVSSRTFCSAATAKRTNESKPVNHKTDQIGLFYTIPDKERKKLYGTGGFPKLFESNTSTFMETCVMIRQPALEIIEYMKKANYKWPAIRYVLYGKPGIGKSLSLVHIIHYAYCEGFYIVHVPWVWDWFRNNRTETAPSVFAEGLLDLPVISSNWLKHFQTQNSHLLSGDEDKLIRLSKDYVWNQRESTPAGSSLSDLVLYGINRVKYSAAVVSALISELKTAATDGSCKVLVAVDGINGFFSTASNVKADDRSKVFPNKVSLVHCFLEATKQDWNNGAVVVTVDQRCGYLPDNQSPLPLYLLTREGFEHLDPFIPVEVKELTSEEVHSMLDYYEDRHWIHNRKSREDLSFLSNHNIGVLARLCRSL